MAESTPYSEIEAAIDADDVAIARRLVKRYQQVLREQNWGNRLLRHAARRDNVEMVAVFPEFGFDINAPDADGQPEGAILEAAGDGVINVVRWLLDHGAKINQEVDGVVRCIPLSRAARHGHLEVVKMLVEHGADINAVWAGHNALSFSIMYGQEEVEAYLRSQGALEPWQLASYTPPKATKGILAHIKRHLGKPKELSLQEIVPGDPPIDIHLVPMKDRLALVTSGMSDRPMNVPKGSEAYRFAELVLYLPKQWQLTAKALKDPNNSWPIEWLRQVARYPHENETWLGGRSAIIANGEPPEPLAPDTQLTCLLALAEPDEFGRLVLNDGRQVMFYTLYPLYTEERDLETQKGIEHLLQLFIRYKVSPIVDVARVNVVAGKSAKGSR